jgi:hypothetical protein
MHDARFINPDVAFEVHDMDITTMRNYETFCDVVRCDCCLCSSSKTLTATAAFRVSMLISFSAVLTTSVRESPSIGFVWQDFLLLFLL